MVEVTNNQFEEFIQEGIAAIPPLYRQRLQNVAFLLEDEPTPEQRTKLNLYPHETLFGLYEGVPLPQRGGTTKILPDKITLFKKPLQNASRDLNDLKEAIRHTVWHEVAHYYGLDHKRIHELDGTSS
ncbi:MAG TPA: metallopeptidase family protein [Candidatus Nitrosopolaris sp.]|nr:metallopeptidase family protein [Candidatus Nitrosopolaris sp.]